MELINIFNYVYQLMFCFVYTPLFVLKNAITNSLDFLFKLIIYPHYIPTEAHYLCNRSGRLLCLCR